MSVAIASKPDAASARTSKFVKQQEKKTNRKRRIPLLPALLFLVVVTQLPFLVTIGISFINWNVMYPNDIHFAGFDNYVTVLTDPRVQAAMVNTVVIIVLGVGISLAIGTGLALLLNRRFFGRGVVRTLLITPFLLMPMAASMMWKHLMFDPNYGLISGIVDGVRRIFGLPGMSFDLIKEAPMTAILITLIWAWTPFMMLIVLAGLQSQNAEVLEAADVDGASGWHKFRFLTLPHLRQYMELCIVLGTIYLLNTYDQIFGITQGGPGSATTNLPYEIFLIEFRKLDYGEACAAGVLIVILASVIATFGLRLVSSLASEGTSKAKKGGAQ